EKTTILYFITGLISMQAVVKNNIPFTKLRLFVMITMAAGYFGAVFLFSHQLGLEMALNTGAILLLGAVLVIAFGIERLLTKCVRNYDRRKMTVDGRLSLNVHSTLQKEDQ
ncbi:MAG: ATPase, partial [Eubacterium sp.]|nr:ATPase [Eubacterium sp.]